MWKHSAFVIFCCVSSARTAILYKLFKARMIRGLLVFVKKPEKNYITSQHNKFRLYVL